MSARKYLCASIFTGSVVLLHFAVHSAVALSVVAFMLVVSTWDVF